MYLKNKSNNPTGRADEFGFSHRFKAGHQLSAQRYTAILYQAVAEASNTPFVSIQPTSLEDFAAAGGSKTVAVTASGEWNIVNDTATDTWITVSKSGNNAIIATAANTAANAEDRIGSVTISVAGTSATLTIDVTQLS